MAMLLNTDVPVGIMDKEASPVTRSTALPHRFTFDLSLHNLSFQCRWREIAKQKMKRQSRRPQEGQMKVQL